MDRKQLARLVREQVLSGLANPSSAGPAQSTATDTRPSATTGTPA
jgi:hypothetical protein